MTKHNLAKIPYENYIFFTLRELEQLEHIFLFEHNKDLFGQNVLIVRTQLEHKENVRTFLF